MEDSSEAIIGFRDLGLSAAVLKALEKIGYEVPSSIQAQTIPAVLEGRDLVGQAQTGTGKTAAFALPLLSKLKHKATDPQVLVLTPTRELAIQVAEAFHKYASEIPGFQVLPVYGGQGYTTQLRQLKRGTHVIVGTPGRLCDHLRRGTLDLKNLQCLVIDEADEMLRMGFIEEVEWILEQTPSTRQVTLFSATMPEPIRRIARRHLKDPVEVTIQSKTSTAATIRQRYWMVSGLHKLDALTRILEGEDFEAMLVFVRTKSATTELAERLQARGFACAALNGDIPQNQREKTIEQLRKGDLDILVATDVAARGLDVSRISHVVNFDIPYDTESYVHRIGRTGRAGRAGEAILFVAPRERRLLHAIEKATKQKIELMQLPSVETINDARIAQFKQRISDTLAEEELGFYYNLVEQFRQEHNVPALEIAAALAKLVQGDTPMLLTTDARERSFASSPREEAARPSERAERQSFESKFDKKRKEVEKSDRPEKPRGGAREEMQRYRLDVGREHGVKPAQIVGAIANEAGLEGRNIGQIDIHDEYTVVDLPAGMPKEIFQTLKKTRVCGRPLKLEVLDDPGYEPKRAPTTKAPRDEKKKFGKSSFGEEKKKFSKPSFGEKKKFGKPASGEKKKFGRKLDFGKPKRKKD